MQAWKKVAVWVWVLSEVLIVLALGIAGAWIEFGTFAGKVLAAN